jgi:predicted nucleic acid-binding protein
MPIMDSSTLILLAKCGLLDIFIDNLKTQLIIPKAVETECTSKKDTYDAKLITQRINEKKIVVQIANNLKICKKLIRDFNVAKGEAEALTLCLDKNQLLLTDDKKAINACKILRLAFATAPDILIRAFEKGLIEHEQAMLIFEKLMRYGRYSEDIIQDVKDKLTLMGG